MGGSQNPSVYLGLGFQGPRARSWQRRQELGGAVSVVSMPILLSLRLWDLCSIQALPLVVDLEDCAPCGQATGGPTPANPDGWL